jgi:hypothetical protein
MLLLSPSGRTTASATQGYLGLLLAAKGQGLQRRHYVRLVMRVLVPRQATFARFGAANVGFAKCAL